MKLLTKAIAFACKKHESQKKEGTDVPYIVHPLEVLSIASTLTDDEKVLAAAVLHDVVKKDRTTIRQIRKKFGEEVGRLIAHVTDSEDKIGTSKTEWEDKKRLFLIAEKIMGNESQTIVLADKLSELRAIYRDYNVIGDKLWMKFICNDKTKQKWYYEQIGCKLRHEFVCTEAYLEYWKLFSIVFNENKWYEMLIDQKFIDYFSNEENIFYTKINDKIVKAPMFENFSDVVDGITMAQSYIHYGNADRYSNDHNFLRIPPYMYSGFRVAYEGLLREQKDFEKILNLPHGSSTGSLYKLDPMALSADKIAVLILYPFWSRMGGSFEITFLDDGRLKKYLLALKKKHSEEAQKNSKE